MPEPAAAPLIGPGDPPPFRRLNAAAAAPVLLLCDHASRAVPAGMARLGLSEEELSRHIGWDIGAAAVTERLAAWLDAPAILAGYSRLVIDCNRHLHDPSAAPAVSDGTVVPGNQGLDADELAARAAAFHAPYHGAVRSAVEDFLARGQVPAVLSIHSCTPVMNGRHRPWQIGVCWDGDDRIARPLMAALARRPGLRVGDNEPYALECDSDYTVPTHAMARGLPHVQIELRQDLIAAAEGAAAYAAILAEALQPILAEHTLYRAARS